MSSSEIDLCGRCNWIPACIFLRNQILNACIRRAAPIESFWCWKIAFQSLFYAHQCIVNNSKSRFHSLGSEEKWHLIYDIWTLTPMRKIRYQLDHQLISPPHIWNIRVVWVESRFLSPIHRCSISGPIKNACIRALWSTPKTIIIEKSNLFARMRGNYLMCEKMRKMWNMRPS